VIDQYQPVREFFMEAYRSKPQLPGALLWLAATGDDAVKQAAASVMMQLEPLSDYGVWPWQSVESKGAEAQAGFRQTCRAKLQALAATCEFVKAALALPAPAGLAEAAV
jgi:hypothetical protein